MTTHHAVGSGHVALASAHWRLSTAEARPLTDGAERSATIALHALQMAPALLQLRTAQAPQQQLPQDDAVLLEQAQAQHAVRMAPVLLHLRTEVATAAAAQLWAAAAADAAAAAVHGARPEAVLPPPAAPAPVAGPAPQAPAGAVGRAVAMWEAQIFVRTHGVVAATDRPAPAGVAVPAVGMFGLRPAVVPHARAAPQVPAAPVCQVCMESVPEAAAPAAGAAAADAAGGAAAAVRRPAGLMQGICAAAGVGGGIRCSALICEPCFRNYLASQLAERAYPVRCPGAACGQDLEYATVEGALISDQTKEDLVTLAVEASVPPAHRIYCPNPLCSALMVLDRPPDPDHVMATCAPGCGTLFCIGCRVEWHHGLTCHEYHALPPSTRPMDAVRQLAGEENWMACPACRHMVERTEGCSHMTCMCGVDFCYDCGRLLDSCQCAERGYDDYEDYQEWDAPGARGAGMGEDDEAAYMNHTMWPTLQRPCQPAVADAAAAGAAAAAAAAPDLGLAARALATAAAAAAAPCSLTGLPAVLAELLARTPVVAGAPSTAAELVGTSGAPAAPATERPAGVAGATAPGLPRLSVVLQQLLARTPVVGGAASVAVDPERRAAGVWETTTGPDGGSGNGGGGGSGGGGGVTVGDDVMVGDDVFLGSNGGDAGAGSGSGGAMYGAAAGASHGGEVAPGGAVAPSVQHQGRVQAGPAAEVRPSAAFTAVMQELRVAFWGGGPAATAGTAPSQAADVGGVALSRLFPQMSH